MSKSSSPLRNWLALAGFIVVTFCAPLFGAAAMKPGAAKACVFPLDMVKLAATPTAEWSAWLAAQMPAPPPVKVPPTARVQTHRYAFGKARLIAFERNVNYTMTENLKQGGGNEALEKTASFEAELTAPAHVYDLRSEKYLGHTAKFSMVLDPWQPSLFALTVARLPDGDVIARLTGQCRRLRVRDLTVLRELDSGSHHGNWQRFDQRREVHCNRHPLDP